MTHLLLLLFLVVPCHHRLLRVLISSLHVSQCTKSHDAGAQAPIRLSIVRYERCPIQVAGVRGSGLHTVMLNATEGIVHLPALLRVHRSPSSAASPPPWSSRAARGSPSAASQAASASRQTTTWTTPGPSLPPQTAHSSINEGGTATGCAHTPSNLDLQGRVEFRIDQQGGSCVPAPAYSTLLAVTDNPLLLLALPLTLTDVPDRSSLSSRFSRIRSHSGRPMG